MPFDSPIDVSWRKMGKISKIIFYSHDHDAQEHVLLYQEGCKFHTICNVVAPFDSLLYIYRYDGNDKNGKNGVK